MANGSVHKRCSCSDNTGKRLGNRCPKLRRPGGAWHPAHGTWAYQLELPTAGRRTQLRRAGFTTREEAQAELDHARSLLDLAAGDAKVADQIAGILRGCRAGTPLPDRDAVSKMIHTPAGGIPTFGDYLDKWLSGRRNLAASTRRNYADHIRMYLKPHLGHIRLDQLRVEDFEAMFAAITGRDHHIQQARQHPDRQVRATVRGQRTLRAASQQRLRATARKALNDAIRTHHRGLLAYNPAGYLELAPGKAPKPRVWTPKHVQHWQHTGARPSPVMVWTPTQAGAFLDHTQHHDPDLYALFVLILHRGLRRGEAIALRDIDIDLDTGELTVAQQITTAGYTAITTKVKTDAGERTIPLDTASTTALRHHLQQRESWRKAARTWPDTGLIFTTRTGDPWHPQAINRRFRALLKSSGLPPVRLHDLRHCAATYLRAAGADLKTVQATLGHADINITADTYTTVLHELERATAEAAANLIPRQDSK
jgi:integrase